MADSPVNGPWTLRLQPEMMADLEAHLFPGDGDEHGAVLGATEFRSRRGVRLLGRRLYLARDGVDYVPGQRGYRMLTASFVADCALDCEAEGLAYLAIHCHGGQYEVGFSRDDLASHERGYPALLDILGGPPVGGLVFARDAVAGDIWLSDRSRVPLSGLVVAGRPVRNLLDKLPDGSTHEGSRYDRQARIFGDRGQQRLANQKVGVIGAGGAGSLIVEQLARLGVGELVVIDPDRIDPTNLPRVAGSRRSDTRPILTHRRMPGWVRTAGTRRRRTKVGIASRLAREAQPGIRFDGIHGDVTRAEVARKLLDCDYLFLAADTMQARLVFNAIVHQYLIPGTQVGAKVQVNHDSGDIIDVFSVVRTLAPGQGCLWCNGLVSPAKLQDESTSAEQLAHQRYVDDIDVPAASVITLNAVAAAHATNDYLMSVTGLLDTVPIEWTRYLPRSGEVVHEEPRRDPDCPECSSSGRLGRGTESRLPVHQ